MESDPLQQKFSVATHPTLPILLFSDGFLVTVLKLPVEVTAATVMRELVLESARYLKKLYEQENLDMTVADAYKLSKGKYLDFKNKCWINFKLKSILFLAHLSTKCSW